MGFTLQPLYIGGKKSLHPDSRGQGGLHSQSGRFGGDEKALVQAGS